MARPAITSGMERFARDRRGAVAVVAALMLPVLIGMVALVGEYGEALLQSSQNQRVADLSAFAGALAYTSSQSTDKMDAAARQVAALNGVAAGDVAVSLVVSPASSERQAVYVRISTRKSLLLAPVLGVDPAMSISAASYAQFGGGIAPCIIALDPSGSGIQLSGGTSVEAKDCSVASDAAVTVPCGTTLEAKQVSYNSPNVPSAPCAGIKGPNGAAANIVRAQTSDPFADSAEIAALSQHTASLRSSGSPGTPSVARGGDIDFAWNQNKTRNQAQADGCTASFASPTWTLTCSGAGPFNFGSITVGGGIKVDFNSTGASNATYNFSGSISNGGSDLAFGSGTFNITQGLSTGGGTVTSFGAGTFWIGKGSCGFSVCNTSTLTFGGPSSFILSAGFSNSGGGNLTFGSGTTNSFQIGKSKTGYAISTGGGSKTVLADAAGATNLFNLIGNVANSGGSCLTLGAASEHDIDGSISAAGGLVLGAGVYSITGYLALGEAGGGSVHCGGRSVGMSGTDVTLVIGGDTLPSGYACRNTALCIAAGYSDVTLVAPDTGDNAGIAVIGPGGNAHGATLSQGASDVQISGLFYFPNGPVSLSGGAGIGGGGGSDGCLQIVGTQINLSGGATAASECVTTGASSGGSSVALVQ